MLATRGMGYVLKREWFERMALTRINPGALAELFELLVRAVYSQAFVAGLTPAQWWVLRYLAKKGGDGELPSAIAEAYLAGRSTVSQTLASLVTKGLVQKDRDRVDGRARRLRLSAAGNAMLKQDPMASLVDALKSLTPRQQHAAAIAIETLVRRIFEARASQARDHKSSAATAKQVRHRRAG